MLTSANCYPMMTVCSWSPSPVLLSRRHGRPWTPNHRSVSSHVGTWRPMSDQSHLEPDELVVEAVHAGPASPQHRRHPLGVVLTQHRVIPTEQHSSLSLYPLYTLLLQHTRSSNLMDLALWRRHTRGQERMDRTSSRSLVALLFV